MHTETEVAAELVNELQDEINRLRAIVYQDELTWLPNRRALFEREADPQATGREYVTMIDLDGLKAKNDAEGHEAGDEYLKDAASVFEFVAKCCEGDCYRLGGDEFAMVCRKHPGKRLDHYNDDPDSAISYSHATVEHSGDLNASLAEADADMYVSKRFRKNERQAR